MSEQDDITVLATSRPVARITVTCWEDGSMSTEGHIEDLTYAIAMLQNAIDAVRDHHRRKGAGPVPKLLTPHYDTPLRN